MQQFKIKKGLKQNLFDNEGNLLITPEEGCWYITTDTSELYVCFNGIVTLIGAQDLESIERFDALEEKVNSIVQTYGYKSSLPLVGSENVIYRIVDENAEYRWDNAAQKYFCVGRDYKEIQIIHGGKAE